MTCKVLGDYTPYFFSYRTNKKKSRWITSPDTFSDASTGAVGFTMQFKLSALSTYLDFHHSLSMLYSTFGGDFAVKQFELPDNTLFQVYHDTFS